MSINFYISVHAFVVEDVLSQYLVSVQAELILLDVNGHWILKHDVTLANLLR
jgi:hypothetical protein